jgi:hypothetical protein
MVSPVAPQWAMPIPANLGDESDLASSVLILFRQVHNQIRDEIEGLDDTGLNWTPCRGANSVATIITHIVGSESETIRSVAGIVDHRDRDAEFLQPWQTTAQVTEALGMADRLIAEVGPQIDDRRLGICLSLPTLPPDEQRSGLTWLIGNYGHAREHVGQVQLTQQLYRSGLTAL